MNRKYSKLLNNWYKSNSRQPLLLLGARQVGKTYLLREFGKSLGGKVHEFNFEESRRLHSIFEEDLTPNRILSSLEFYSGQKILPDKDLILFDEIQECPRALTSLKYFSEQRPDLALTGAGSLLGLNINPASFPVGKVELLNIFPMDFAEFLESCSDDKGLSALTSYDPYSKEKVILSEIAHEHLWKQLKTYFIVGGLPGVVNEYLKYDPHSLEATSAVREKQIQLITMYQADMAKHCGKQNAMHLQRIWQQMPQQLGGTLDGSANKYRFSGVLPKVTGYLAMSGALDWLERAGLVIKVLIANQGTHPSSHFCKENVFKLFCFDVGILGAMSGLAPRAIYDYQYGTYKGYFAENFVAQEFKASGKKNIFSWAEGTAQVEFLLEKDGNVLPIEVKSGHVTQAKSLGVFCKKYASKQAIILSARLPKTQVARMQVACHVPLYAAGKI